MSVAELPYPGIPGGLSLGGPSGGSALWLLDDDTQLRIVTANSVSGVVVGMTGLRLDDKGNVQPIDETHTPNSDRSSKTQDYKIGRGTLLRLTVFIVSGAPLQGQTYVLAQLIRGISGPRKVISTLFGDYITAVKAIGFPGSSVMSPTEGEPVIRNIIGTAPGAGGELSETCPAGARWELMSLFTTLTASAAAGVRFPNLQLVSGAQAFGLWLGNIGVNPSETWLLSFAQNLPNIIYAGQHWGSTAMGLRPLFRAGDKINTSTIGLAGGDIYTAPNYQVREWLEVAA